MNHEEGRQKKGRASMRPGLKLTTMSKCPPGCAEKEGEKVVHERQGSGSRSNGPIRMEESMSSSMLADAELLRSLGVGAVRPLQNSQQMSGCHEKAQQQQQAKEELLQVQKAPQVASRSSAVPRSIRSCSPLTDDQMAIHRKAMELLKAQQLRQQTTAPNHNHNHTHTGSAPNHNHRKRPAAPLPNVSAPARNKMARLAVTLNEEFAPKPQPNEDSRALRSPPLTKQKSPHAAPPVDTVIIQDHTARDSAPSPFSQDNFDDVLDQPPLANNNNNNLTTEPTPPQSNNSDVTQQPNIDTKRPPEDVGYDSGDSSRSPSPIHRGAALQGSTNMMVNHTYVDYSVVDEETLRKLDEKAFLEQSNNNCFKRKVFQHTLTPISYTSHTHNTHHEQQNSESRTAQQMDVARKIKKLQRQMGTTGLSRRNSGGVIQPFPEKLMEVLDRGDIDDVVSWMPHGRAFIVKKPKLFVSEVLPHFFKQSKFMSFTRQLNLWGFKRITKGPDAGAYYHEIFLRGRPRLATRMKRQKIKGTGIKPTPNPEMEPDFYAISAKRPLPPLNHKKDTKPLPPILTPSSKLSSDHSRLKDASDSLPQNPAHFVNNSTHSKPEPSLDHIRHHHTAPVNIDASLSLSNAAATIGLVERSPAALGATLALRPPTSAQSVINTGIKNQSLLHPSQRNTLLGAARCHNGARSLLAEAHHATSMQRTNALLGQFGASNATTTMGARPSVITPAGDALFRAAASITTPTSDWERRVLAAAAVATETNKACAANNVPPTLYSARVLPREDLLSPHSHVPSRFFSQLPRGTGAPPTSNTPTTTSAAASGEVSTTALANLLATNPALAASSSSTSPANSCRSDLLSAMVALRRSQQEHAAAVQRYAAAKVAAAAATVAAVNPSAAAAAAPIATTTTTTTQDAILERYVKSMR